VVGPAGPPVRPAAGPSSDTSPGAEGEGNHAAAVAQAAAGELVAACTRAGFARHACVVRPVAVTACMVATFSGATAAEPHGANRSLEKKHGANQ
jgi:hypothetical protein